MNKRIFLLCATGFLCTVGAAQEKENQQDNDVRQLEEVVVTDSRFSLKREHSGKTVIQITQAELQRNQGRSVAEIINSKSGIEINGSRSNAGQNLSYFVRGGNNRQVLVLIDGIQVSDPSQIAGDYDLRLMDLGEIESIEIVKGASSTLYGNRAATAVINITTKKPEKDKISGNFQSSFGTNQPANEDDYNLSDFSNNASVNGTLGKFSYLAGFGNQYTNGLSAVIGDEKDPFNRINSNINLGYRFSDRFSFKILGYYDKFKAAFDSSSPLQDDNSFSESEQFRVTIAPEYTYSNGSVTLNASYNTIDRDIYSAYPNAYEANSTVVDLFNKYNFSDKFYTIVGINYIKNEATLGAETDFNITDPYANVVWVSNFGLNLNAGGRWNNHSEYGSHFTYNLNPSYVIDLDGSYLKFLGSYSSSYIAPTLSQLFGAFGANPDLKPEEDRTLEGGMEFNNNKFRLSALYFNREAKNFIDYTVVDPDTFESMYTNVEEAFTVNGVEVEVAYNPLEALQLDANYTFTENRDKVALRIPKHKANANISYKLLQKTFLGLNYQYTGERLDVVYNPDFTSENIALDAFSLLNFNINHQFSKRLNVFFNLDNIFNEEYVEVVGYTTKGRNIRAGFRLSL
ncbi:TonB-dependent receptor plug domain-containing protein [Galbibacter pacificus]|uniref:TonB-dependent receptor n=1 Tax=Galbibacter pacificus TaxID=2996052 RepID=A0ABT6FP22_9FLAO|nr:TonB-dependent receptor [Galbibacter pacificus]MDG3581533.1 TonB-dependent receptor [Galbibacter pacificus]MDG3585011.1 TonB-dependent receptor [Galbibacter pacificus]